MHFLLSQPNLNAVTWFGKRNGDGQARASRACDHLEGYAGLLPAEAVQPFRMGFDYGPNTVQRSCQIRAQSKAHRKWTIVPVGLAQSIPGKAEFAQTLHVRPGLLNDRNAIG